MKDSYEYKAMERKPPNDFPRFFKSLAALENRIALAFDGSEAVELPDGSYAVMLCSLGFMEVNYGVATYKSAPGFLRPKRLMISKTELFGDDLNGVLHYFSELTAIESPKAMVLLRGIAEPHFPHSESKRPRSKSAA